MTTQELKALTDEQLATQLAESQARLGKLKFAHALTPLENPMQLRDLRRDVARLQTESTARKNA